jgi:hypothetical protein
MVPNRPPRPRSSYAASQWGIHGYSWVYPDPHMRFLVLVLAGVLLLGVTALILLTPSQEVSPGPLAELGQQTIPTGGKTQEDAPSPMMETNAHPLQRGEARADGSTGALTAIDAASQQPLPGAEVFMVDLAEEDHATWLFRKEPTHECLQMTVDQGMRSVTDAGGRTWISNPTGLGIVVARTDSLFGVLLIDGSSEEPWQVQLSPDPAWTVEVSDVHGNPLAGLPMRLIGTSAQDLNPHEYRRIATDEEGRVQIAHLRALMTRWNCEQLRLEPDALLREPASISFSPENLDPGPKRLTLPAIGTIELALGLPNGEPWTRSQPQRDRVRIRFEDQVHIEPHEIHPDASGRYRMFVQTRQILSASWNLRSTGTVNGSGPGPITPGEEALLVVSTVSGCLVLRMRVMREPDGPLQDTAIQLKQRNLNHIGNGLRRGARKHITDSKGLLIVPVVRPSKEHITTLTLSDSSTPEHETVLRVLGDPADLVVDFGDVWLKEPPTLLAGRIVHPDGTPHPHARVEIQSQPLDAHRPSLDQMEMVIGDNKSQQQIDSMREHFGKIGATAAWKLGPRLQVNSDGAGEFHAYSAETLTAVRARGVYLDDVPGDWHEFPPGSEGVEIVLATPAKVSGSVLMPKGLSPSKIGLRLSLRPPGEAVITKSPKIGPDGLWESHGLRPGTWTASIFQVGVFSWDALTENVKFTLVAGEDLQLPPMDLASAVSVVSLSVIDKDGSPVKGTQGTHNYPDNSDIKVTEGKATILVNKEDDVAWFGAPGYRVEKLEDPKDGDTVVLRSGIQVHLRLTNPEILRGATKPLLAQLNGWCGDNWMLHTIRQGAAEAFDANGEVTLLAPSDGPLSLRLTLDKKVSLERVSGDPLTIKDQEALQSFTITLDPKTSAERISKMKD